jgi:hypothetical protein
MNFQYFLSLLRRCISTIIKNLPLVKDLPLLAGRRMVTAIEDFRISNCPGLVINQRGSKKYQYLKPFFCNFPFGATSPAEPGA